MCSKWSDPVYRISSKYAFIEPLGSSADGDLKPFRWWLDAFAWIAPVGDVLESFQGPRGSILDVGTLAKVIKFTGRYVNEMTVSVQQ